MYRFGIAPNVDHHIAITIMHFALTAVQKWTEVMATRLIEPNELEKVLRPILTDESCPLHIAAEIDMNIDLMPKVNAVPVRHGRWIETKHGFCCNQCHARRPLDWDGQMWLSSFCPNCGARMNGKDGDADGV